MGEMRKGSRLANADQEVLDERQRKGVRHKYGLVMHQKRRNVR
jgi:hypothetical protein